MHWADENFGAGFNGQPLSRHAGACGTILHQMGQEARASLYASPSSSSSPSSSYGPSSSYTSSAEGSGMGWLILGVISAVGLAVYFSAPPSARSPVASDSTRSLTSGSDGYIATVSAENLNLRPCPDATAACAPIAVLPQGTQVKIIDRGANGWLQIQTVGAGGQSFTGFANGQYLKSE
jgi:hypothetical protein